MSSVELLIQKMGANEFRVSLALLKQYGVLIPRSPCDRFSLSDEEDTDGSLWGGQQFFLFGGCLGAVNNPCNF